MSKLVTPKARKPLTIKEILELKKQLEESLLAACDRNLIKGVEIVLDLTDEGMDQI